MTDEANPNNTEGQGIWPDPPTVDAAAFFARLDKNVADFKTSVNETPMVLDSMDDWWEQFEAFVSIQPNT